MPLTANIATYPVQNDAPDRGATQRQPIEKRVLLLLTLFFGGIGAHKFYLGKFWQGGLYLLFFWTFIPAVVALVEFVVYAFTSPVRLNEKYSAPISPWVIALLATTFIFMLAMLFAVAAFAFNDYRTRNKVADGVAMATNLKLEIEELFARNGPANMSCQPGNCPFTVGHLGSTSYVNRIYSDKTGAITIEYDDQVASPPQNRLALLPQIDGKTADLSAARNLGKNVTWKCGRDAATTIVPKLLPLACR